MVQSGTSILQHRRNNMISFNAYTWYSRNTAASWVTSWCGVTRSNKWSQVWNFRGNSAFTFKLMIWTRYRNESPAYRKSSIIYRRTLQLHFVYSTVILPICINGVTGLNYAEQEVNFPQNLPLLYRFIGLTVPWFGLVCNSPCRLSFQLFCLWQHFVLEVFFTNLTLISTTTEQR